jgi:hypothetical protein
MNLCASPHPVLSATTLLPDMTDTSLLASVIHLWAAIRGISFTVTSPASYLIPASSPCLDAAFVSEAVIVLSL